MVFLDNSTEWPVFGTNLDHQAPVEFYFSDNPETLFMTIENQNMYLYPTSELRVTNTEWMIDETGMLTSSWLIENLIDVEGVLQWFLIGDDGTPLSPSSGSLTIEAEGNGTVEFNSQLSPSMLTQTLSLGVVSLKGPRMSGSSTVDFRFTYSVPEPTSILSFLALGTLGTALTLKRKLKSFKSTERKNLTAK
ncbi:MAG: PEP-CTERM sorting domain-containing protein [Okeania sp. SIO2D1]|nr:PEP-CTERM sorting domain-containing protein [Okeania sp. SIO2C9]NES68701.1 PEP-CTERM sorting domain-containing protein [Okeania sp. SIO2D1]